MKPKNHRIIFMLIIVFIISVSCSIPGITGSEMTTEEFPETPNATLTALFAQATMLTPEEPHEIQVTDTPSTGEEIQNTATVTHTTGPTQTITATTGITSTNTPPPTLTSNPMERPGGFYIAKYLATAPTIDGDWSEWTSLQYPAGHVVYGLGEWDDDEDLESSFRVGWDYTYLYLAVKVKDEKYVQNATGYDLYKGDSIELLLDVDLYGDFYTSSLSTDDYQLGVSPGKGSLSGPKEAYLWLPSSVAGDRTSQVEIASIVGGDGVYRVEIRIPWSLFGVTPTVNKHFGFGVSVSDNDNEGSNVQQSMVSCISGRSLTNPRTWGELVLGN